MEVVNEEHKHFVLVHGLCHGGWSWYKLKLRLESAGHRVTALDLSASGTNTKTLNEVRTFYEYSRPLMELMASLSPNEKVILVGHSLGGLNIGLAMDKYPHKILAAVFLAAFMPDTAHPPSHVINQHKERTPLEARLEFDTELSSYGSPTDPLTSILFGPKYLAFRLYNQCCAEDLALATILTRPGSTFVEDLSKANNFSNEGYGSVNRVYIICDEDKGMPVDFQHWMIENSPVKEVKEINGADHMAMLSTPDELCRCLLEIANKYP